MTENNKIKIFLKKLFFKKSVPKNFSKLDILSYGKLDSFSIFRLIIKIETKYKIKFSDKELFSNKFENLNNISKLIIKKKK